MQTESQLQTVKQFAAMHPWPTMSALRNYIFNAEVNGFNSVIKRVGRRVLIDEAAFFTWVNSKSAGSVKEGV